MTDNDYLKVKSKNTNTNTNTNQRIIEQKKWQHRERQTEFYKACSRHLLQLNKTWVSYHDLDEFVTFQHKVKRPRRYVWEIGLKKMKRPGYILDTLNKIKNREEIFISYNTSGSNSDGGGGKFSCTVINRVRYNAENSFA